MIRNRRRVKIVTSPNNHVYRIPEAAVIRRVNFESVSLIPAEQTRRFVQVRLRNSAIDLDFSICTTPVEKVHQHFSANTPATKRRLAEPRLPFANVSTKWDTACVHGVTNFNITQLDRGFRTNHCGETAYGDSPYSGLDAENQISNILIQTQSIVV